MFTANCSLVLSNNGVEVDELERVFAKELSIGVSKSKVDLFVDEYSRTHFKEVQIYGDLVEFGDWMSGPNDEKIKDVRDKIKSYTSMNIPNVDWTKYGSTYIHIAFYYDENDNLVRYTFYEGINK